MKYRSGLAAAVLAVAAVAAAPGCKGGSSSGGPGSSAPGASTAGSGAVASDSPTSGAAGGSAACPPVPAPPELVTAKLPRPFFFHATKRGHHDVWLFGTLHLGVSGDAIPTTILARLTGAKAFAMEADTEDQSMLAAVMRSDGKTLQDELGAETWHKLACAVGDEMADHLQHMKLYIAATALDAQGLPPTPPPLTLEAFLRSAARRDGKRVVFLEPMSRQLALLEKWMDAKVLRESLDDLGDTRKTNGELMTAYVAGDDAKVLAMSQDEAAFVKAGHTHDDFVKMMKELLLDRNAAWIAKIEDLGHDGETFVAVGAMHLIGPGSVPDLLAKDGWTVERVAP